MAKTSVAKVDDFDAIKNELGLVPMRFLQGTITEVIGDIRGAEPYTALRWYNDGLAEPISSEKLPSAPKEKAPRGAVKSTDLTVTIPDDWADQHHLQRIKLAKALNGSDESLSTEKADEVIKAEVARRAAA